jgi:hypothetical protein
MALAWTQPVTEMSARSFPAGKVGRHVWPRTLQHSCADRLEVWEPQPPGTLRTCPSVIGTDLPLLCTEWKVEGRCDRFYSTNGTNVNVEEGLRRME